jgi:hypothetical protein
MTFCAAALGTLFLRFAETSAASVSGGEWTVWDSEGGSGRALTLLQPMVWKSMRVEGLGVGSLLA